MLTQYFFDFPFYTQTFVRGIEYLGVNVRVDVTNQVEISSHVATDRNEILAYIEIVFENGILSLARATPWGELSDDTLVMDIVRVGCG